MRSALLKSAALMSHPSFSLNVISTTSRLLVFQRPLRSHSSRLPLFYRGVGSVFHIGSFYCNTHVAAVCQEFRCLSALPEGTGRVPILSVCGIQTGTSSVFCPLSCSHVVVLASSLNHQQTAAPSGGHREAVMMMMMMIWHRWNDSRCLCCSDSFLCLHVTVASWKISFSSCLILRGHT